MTRKSKREIERVLEDLDVPTETSESSLTSDQQAAIRAALRWRRCAYPDGNAPPQPEVFQEALEHIKPEHADALREVIP